MLRFLHPPHLGFCLVVACTAPLYKDTNLTEESDLGGSTSARFQRFEGKVGIALAVARRVSQSQMNRRDKSRRAKGELLSAVGVRLKSTKIRDGVLCAVLCFSFGAWAQTTAPINENAGSQVKPQESVPIDAGVPQRLRLLIAPTSSTPWHAPDLSDYTRALKSSELSPINSQQRYELNSDCTVSATFLGVISAHFVVVNNGKDFRGVMDGDAITFVGSKVN